MRKNIHVFVKITYRHKSLSMTPLSFVRKTKIRSYPVSGFPKFRTPGGKSWGQVITRTVVRFTSTLLTAVYDGQTWYETVTAGLLRRGVSCSRRLPNKQTSTARRRLRVSVRATLTRSDWQTRMSRARSVRLQRPPTIDTRPATEPPLITCSCRRRRKFFVFFFNRLSTGFCSESRREFQTTSCRCNAKRLARAHRS